ncbi:MAG: GNAT family N-acetyltransferase [Anaerolineales bacterium]|nr:GNAT family N-acetyltransferase [Anaerolineales bacterium]
MNPNPPAPGPRRANFPQDVPQITRLVEVGFGGMLDYASRRMLRDVRAVAEMGGPVWSLSRRIGAVQPGEWAYASVWDEAGRITGNVTISRRAPERDAWLLSNVTVHPECRRQGIARELVRHALESIRREGGRNTYLQVDADNESALRMYREAGFVEIGGRTAWFRPREERRIAQPGAAAGSARTCAPRKPSEWAEELALWREVSPHGVAWNTPLTERTLRPSLRKSLEWFLAGEKERHFLARCGGRVDAALSAFSRLPGWEAVLIQREGTRGMVEAGLLDAAWKIFPPAQSLLLEATPEASSEILVQLGFQKRRTFIWMRYTFTGGAL